MRFAPAAAAMSLALAITASVGSANEAAPDPRALALAEEGRAALANGDANQAIDLFETALAVDPAFTQIFIDLGEATRAQGMQVKAIGYYREALERDPNNFAAISGEGEALAERGAIEKARRNLAQLQSLCGENCAETLALEASIRMEVQTRMAAGESAGTTVN